MTVWNDDDVWDDTTEGDDLARERRTRYDRHFNSGYMEGIDVGKTEEAQPGFDAGYAAGVPEGERLGRLQGQVDALRVLNRQQASGSETTMQVSCSMNCGSDACAERRKNLSSLHRAQLVRQKP